jgi:hypothetical protein
MHHGFGKDHSQLRIVGRSVKSEAKLIEPDSILDGSWHRLN